MNNERLRYRNDIKLQEKPVIIYFYDQINESFELNFNKKSEESKKAYSKLKKVKTESIKQMYNYLTQDIY